MDLFDASSQKNIRNSSPYAAQTSSLVLSEMVKRLSLGAGKHEMKQMGEKGRRMKTKKRGYEKIIVDFSVTLKDLLKAVRLGVLFGEGD